MGDFRCNFIPCLVGNLGHKIFKLKVISAEDGSDWNAAGKGAFREGIKSALSILLEIPGLWIFFDDDNQTLHDKIAKTYVVKKK